MSISPSDFILREQLPAELQKPQLGTTIAVSATTWILSNVRREQEIVQRLIKYLPAGDLQVANELSGAPSLQGSLSALLVLNIIVTAIAFGLVIRGYMTSERSLHNVKVLATDILASVDAGVITTSGDGVERIEKLVRLLRPQAEKQNVTLPMNLSEEKLTMIDADATRLEQLFLNLALNGLVAMPNGGPLEFSVSQNGENLRIDVRDTGMGIPAEIQPRIFDPYFTTRREGTGMGLALSDKFIRQQDGNTDFESNPQGTRFTVFIPNLQT